MPLRSRALPAFLAAAETLYPGYFALVMATGALSTAFYLLDLRAASYALLVVNALAYAILWALLVTRILCFRARLAADLVDYTRSPGFFTLVAGTSMLGAEIAATTRLPLLALFLWFAGILLWVLIMYGFFAIIETRADKPGLESGINGAWLLAAVATQSIAVLGGLLAPGFAAPALPLFFCLIMYLIGGMLYLSIITLIFYRMTFIRLTTATFTPAYWINMGAAAISTLAGATLISCAPLSPILREVLPFLEGFTLFFWAAGSWWIPSLVILEIWRHAVLRQPFRYDPQYWSMAFPLAMYTLATLRLSDALRFPPLLVVPRIFVWFAGIVWLVVFTGLVRRILSGWRGPVRAS